MNRTIKKHKIMGNLHDHAQRELEMAGLFGEEDFYGGHTGNAVIELIDVFEKQGHSGMSAPMVISLFKELGNFKPINAIKCDTEEWNEVGNGTYQHKRLSALFKEKDSGDRPYYLDAIVWQEEGGGSFTGSDIEGYNSRQFVRLPFMPKTFYVKVSKNRKILDRETLQKALEYYQP